MDVPSTGDRGELFGDEPVSTAETAMGGRRVVRQSIAALLSLAIVLVVAGCDNLGPQYQRLAVERVENSVAVRYQRCSGEEITQLELWELDDDNIATEDGDRVIWTATENELAMLDDGAIIPSDDAGPLVLRQGQKYWLDIETSHGSADSNSFRLDQLTLDSVRVDRSDRDLAEFLDEAIRSC